MPNIPANADMSLWGVNAVFRISGATFVTIGNLRLQWGNRIMEEHVVGSDIPYLGTGGFHGEIECDVIGSVDNRWEQIVDGSGQLTTYGMTWIENPTSGARTWTVSGKFSELQKISERDNSVRFRIRGTMVTRPTVVNS